MKGWFAIFTTRNNIYIIFTMTVTWFCWWLLAFLSQAGHLSIEGGWGLALFIIGGSAPTVGAYVAIVKTGDAGSLREYHTRVLKFRVAFYYYLYALGIPLLLGLGGLMLVSLIDTRNLLEIVILVGTLRGIGVHKAYKLTKWWTTQVF